MVDFNIKYLFSHQTNFKMACGELNKQLKELTNVFKISFFLEAFSNNDFMSKKQFLERTLESYFGTLMPGLTFVSQKPLGQTMAVEVLCFKDAGLNIEYKATSLCRYQVLSGDNTKKALFINNLEGSLHHSTIRQCSSLFNEIKAVFLLENFDVNSIIRQWNYIPNITRLEGEIQNYQAFNDARTKLYNQTQWPVGYPSATGIGTQYGAVHIDLLALKGYNRTYGIHNKEQIDAHCYSTNMLEGKKTELLKDKSTPKFERAKLIIDKEKQLLFISGTAAIKGEENYYQSNARKQTRLTLDHIEELMLSANNLTHKQPVILQAMRVYVKHENDLADIKKICEERYPTTAVIYLLSDICRDSLLVEIEGVAVSIS